MPMNNRKIDFIICTNDSRQFAESCLYINHLDIPKDYEVNILEIREAASIFAGYNEGMNASDAKYKVYMHHDVRIIDRNFIHIMLDRFKNPAVGMLGVVGCTTLKIQPWKWDAGAIAETIVSSTSIRHFAEEETDKYVKQIDGLLMATQYDLPWREDWFGGWDIYDRSQCLEFLKAGFKILVPGQEQPICLHDCGVADLSGYAQVHELFLEHYAAMFMQDAE